MPTYTVTFDDKFINSLLIGIDDEIDLQQSVFWLKFFYQRFESQSKVDAFFSNLAFIVEYVSLKVQLEKLRRMVGGEIMLVNPTHKAATRTNPIHEHYIDVMNSFKNATLTYNKILGIVSSSEGDSIQAFIESIQAKRAMRGDNDE